MLLSRMRISCKQRKTCELRADAGGGGPPSAPTSARGSAKAQGEAAPGGGRLPSAARPRAAVAMATRGLPPRSLLGPRPAARGLVEAAAARRKSGGAIG